MRIEKRYYDIEKEQWDQIVKEVQEEESQLTEAEREAQVQKRNLELQEIYRKSEERAKHRKKIADKKKAAQFQLIAQKTLWLAKYAKVNIIVNTETELLGEIVLEAKDFVIPCVYSPAVKEIFSSLFLASDDIYVGCSSGLCKMQFLFDLYKEVSLDEPLPL